MKYKIYFKGTNKNWTSDLMLVKEYCKQLKTDCLHLFLSATIQVDNNENIETYKLSEWLLLN